MNGGVPGICGLCGLRALGWAFVSEDGQEIRLCHDTRRDCYQRWTVYDDRPPRIRNGQSLVQAWLKWVREAAGV